MTPPTISARRIGTERQPVAIIDDFHPDADALRSFAAHAAFEPGRNHYPGIRASLPDDYFAKVRPALLTTLAGVFDHDGGVDLIDASYSMVTTPPHALTRAQRLPHMDAVTLDRIALVHYLDPAGGDGTAFYRHRSTGYETIDAARSSAYLDRLNRELREPDEDTAGYINASTALFERVAHVEARFNRALVYRSVLLHSGAIAPDARLSVDPLDGRLTVTAFLSLRPPEAV